MKYQQPICWTTWNDVWFNKMREITQHHHNKMREITQRHNNKMREITQRHNNKMREITLRHNAQHHLGQKRILFVSLTTRTCNVWHNVLSRICRSIWRHFKRSVNTLINRLMMEYMCGAEKHRRDYGDYLPLQESFYYTDTQGDNCVRYTARGHNSGFDPPNHHWYVSALCFRLYHIHQHHLKPFWKHSPVTYLLWTNA